MTNTERFIEISIIYKKISKSVFFHHDEPWLCVLEKAQNMFVMHQSKIITTYRISTSLNGLGCLKDSFKTPTGLHFIANKIGQGVKKNKIFKARKETDEYADITLDNTSSNVDLITSRILRLSGLEVGKNFGENVDSYRRYIYIHGTNEEGLIGKAVSHGCIRMNNNDVIQLFDVTSEQTLVYIH